MAELTEPWTAFDYAVVDVEGNGQQPPDAVEISIVAIKNGSIGQARNWLIRRPRPVTHLATPPAREPLTLAELLDAARAKTTSNNAADEPAATLF